MQLYEVSDGALGDVTIRGFYASHIEAVRAFERAHGHGFRGSAIVYTRDEEGSCSDCYAVCDDGSICQITMDA